MQIAQLVTDATATPTTVSTGRDASPPGIGSVRLLAIAALGQVIMFILHGAAVWVHAHGGPDFAIDSGLVNELAGFAVSFALEYFRRRSADLVVERKKEDRAS
jgi:hypothetical protein